MHLDCLHEILPLPAAIAVPEEQAPSKVPASGTFPSRDVQSSQTDSPSRAGPYPFSVCGTTFSSSKMFCRKPGLCALSRTLPSRSCIWQVRRDTCPARMSETQTLSLSMNLSLSTLTRPAWSRTDRVQCSTPFQMSSGDGSLLCFTVRFLSKLQAGLGNRGLPSRLALNPSRDRQLSCVRLFCWRCRAGGRC